jgi:hypothetical protein
MDIANDVMPYATAAICAYGIAVLAQTGELAADTEQARGARILQRIFGRGDAFSRKVIEQVATSEPGDEPGRDGLKAAITEAVLADPHLARELAAMLPRVTAPI